MTMTGYYVLREITGYIFTYHKAAKVGKVVAMTGDNISINLNEFTSISSPVSTAT